MFQLIRHGALLTLLSMPLDDSDAGWHSRVLATLIGRANAGETYARRAYRKLLDPSRERRIDGWRTVRNVKKRHYYRSMYYHRRLKCTGSPVARFGIPGARLYAELIRIGRKDAEWSRNRLHSDNARCELTDDYEIRSRHGGQVLAVNFARLRGARKSLGDATFY